MTHALETIAETAAGVTLGGLLLLAVVARAAARLRTNLMAGKR